MAALRAAKQALRKEVKRRVATVTDDEKRRQSLVVSQKVRKCSWKWVMEISHYVPDVASPDSSISASIIKISPKKKIAIFTYVQIHVYTDVAKAQTCCT